MKKVNMTLKLILTQDVIWYAKRGLPLYEPPFLRWNTNWFDNFVLRKTKSI